MKDMLVIADSSTILQGKMCDIKIMEKIYVLCYKEGFNGINIAYLGGDWVWTEFKKCNSCSKFKQM